jgi:hypothetical protein
MIVWGWGKRHVSCSKLFEHAATIGLNTFGKSVPSSVQEVAATKDRVTAISVCI